eukprot:3941129-Rhodomonas_salina.2
MQVHRIVSLRRDVVRSHSDSGSGCARKDAPMDDGASPESDGRLSHHGPLQCAVSSDRAGRAHLPILGSAFASERVQSDARLGVGSFAVHAPAQRHSWRSRGSEGLKDDFGGDGADQS